MYYSAATPVVGGFPTSSTTPSWSTATPTMRRWPSSRPRGWTCSARTNATKASSPAAAPTSTIRTTTRWKLFISPIGRKAEMARRLELTLACGDYELVRALKEGTGRPEGAEPRVLTDMAPSPRHWRFLRGRELDLAEVSGSGYVAARDQDLAFRAIPVFPPRRFRHGFIFI